MTNEVNRTMKEKIGTATMEQYFKNADHEITKQEWLDLGSIEGFNLHRIAGAIKDSDMNEKFVKDLSASMKFLLGTDIAKVLNTSVEDAFFIVLIRGIKEVLKARDAAIEEEEAEAEDVDSEELSVSPAFFSKIFSMNNDSDEEKEPEEVNEDEEVEFDPKKAMEILVALEDLKRCISAMKA